MGRTGLLIALAIPPLFIRDRRPLAALAMAIAAKAVLLDERDTCAERRAARSDDQAARAAADHHDIEFGFHPRTD